MNEILSALILICGASAYNGNGSLSTSSCPYKYKCETQVTTKDGKNEVVIKCTSQD